MSGFSTPAPTFTAYTPTVGGGVGTGTFTASGLYYRWGNLGLLQVTLNCSVVGTATNGNITVTLPSGWSAAAHGVFLVMDMDNQTISGIGSGTIDASAPTIVSIAMNANWSTGNYSFYGFVPLA